MEHNLQEGEFFALTGIVGHQAGAPGFSNHEEEIEPKYRSVVNLYGGVPHPSRVDRSEYGIIDGILLDPTPDGKKHQTRIDEPSIPFEERLLTYKDNVLAVESSSVLKPLDEGLAVVDTSRDILRYIQRVHYYPKKDALTVSSGVQNHANGRNLEAVHEIGTHMLKADTVAARALPVVRALHTAARIFELIAVRDPAVTVQILEAPGIPKL